MNQHSDIRSLFLLWFEEKLNPADAQRLDEHLSGCGSCRQYFDTLSSAVRPRKSTQRSLESDPYLPARIRAHGKETTSFSPSGRELVVRWSLATLVFAAAIVAGVYMGERLSYQPSGVTDQHIISEYSNYLGESGIADRWQTVALTSEAVAK